MLEDLIHQISTEVDDILFVNFNKIRKAVSDIVKKLEEEIRIRNSMKKNLDDVSQNILMVIFLTSDFNGSNLSKRFCILWLLLSEICSTYWISSLKSFQISSNFVLSFSLSFSYESYFITKVFFVLNSLLVTAQSQI